MESIKEGGLEMITKEVLIGPKQDNAFRALVALNVLENYFRRTVAEKTKNGSLEYTKVREGDERDNKLVGLLMLKHRRGIQHHSTGHIKYGEKIKFAELGEKLVREASSHKDGDGKNHPYKDGGYVIKEGKDGSSIVSDKHVFHNYLTKSLREYNKVNKDNKLKNFLRLAEMLVPTDFSASDGSSLIIGSKSQMALAAGDSYLVKQTVYDGTEVGKVVKVGKMLEGVEAEFFLYKILDSEIQKYSHLKEEAFFNPKEKVIGILRTYKPGLDKSVRNEYVITPKEIGIEQEIIRQYVPQENAVPVTVTY